MSVDPEVLLRRADWIRGLALHLARNAADADDIVQQVFLRLHRGLPTLHDDERVYAWIFRTARNAIADYYRAAGPRREVASGDLSDLDSLDAAIATQATTGPDDEPGAALPGSTGRRVSFSSGPTPRGTALNRSSVRSSPSRS